MVITELPRTSPIPKVTPAGDWEVTWDRSAEIGVASEFLAEPIGRLKLLVISNLSREHSANVAISMAKSVGADIVRLPHHWSPQIISVGVAGYLTETTSVAPPSICAEILKYTTAAAVFTASGSSRLRSVSNYIHTQRRAGAPVYLADGLRRYGLNLPEAAENPLCTQSWVETKISESSYPALLEQDLRSSAILIGKASSTIFYNASMVGRRVERYAATVNLALPLRIITSNTSRLGGPMGTVRAESGLCDISFNVLDEASAAEFIGDIIKDVDQDQLKNILAGVGLSLNINPIVGGRYYSERELTRALNAASSITRELLIDQNIEPIRSLLQAEVEGDVLRLGGLRDAASGSSPEILDALREDHLQEISRLRRMLAGSNVGSGFTSRLEAVERRLAMPLSEANAVVLASQVRGLEVMFSPVTEMLTDVTAADLGASLASLGLFVRQFSAWREFLDEASASESLKPETLNRVDEAAEIVVIDSASVDSELVSYLEEIRTLSQVTDDEVERIGYMRAVSNIYRAIGRYARERIKGSKKAFETTVDTAIGTGGATFIFGTSLLALKPVLIQLAAALPDEFGWLIPLLTALSALAASAGV